MANPPDISVVIPVFNEQENLPELHRRLLAVLNTLRLDWEVLVVDDASTDNTPQLLGQFHRENPRFKVLTLSRNFGHQPALTAGINHATGRAIILLDADLQDPPELIPELIHKWREGWQIVLGQRRSRHERAIPRRFGFRLFYPLFHWLSDLPQSPSAGIFCLMDRVAVDHFNQLPERSRFIPGLRSWIGFRQASVPYDRQQRAAGTPKQTLRRLFHYAADAIFSFSYKPLRLATWLGFLSSTLAFALAVYYFITFFAFNKPFGTGFTTTIICVLFLGGVQLISIGILGQYIARIYEEVKQRPLYIISDRLGFDPQHARESARIATKAESDP